MISQISTRESPVVLKVQISSTWGDAWRSWLRRVLREKFRRPRSMCFCIARSARNRKENVFAALSDGKLRKNQLFALRTKVIAVIARMATDARYFHEFATRKLVGSDGSRLVLRLLTWVGRIVAVSGVVLVAVVANRTIVGVLLMRTAVVVLSWIAILIVVAALSTVARKNSSESLSYKSNHKHTHFIPRRLKL